MQIYDVPTAQATILRRGMWDEVEVSKEMAARIETIFGERLSPDAAVRIVLRDVRDRGDAALREWARRIDGVELDSIQAPPDAAKQAYDQVDLGVAHAMRLAARRIEEFHLRQPSISWIHNDEEGTLGQLVRPIQRIGVYTPGGTAPLPSSLLMTAIPAKVAGVQNVVVITPPQRDTGLPHPLTLVAAEIAGVDAVYVSGGAQAIGALAFGTETVQRVDKICGPGNLFTMLAKRQVYGMVGIDGLPGPTETVVIADEHADAEMVASDMLAQAEHDVLASAILLTPSVELAERVQRGCPHADGGAGASGDYCRVAGARQRDRGDAEPGILFRTGERVRARASLLARAEPVGTSWRGAKRGRRLSRRTEFRGAWRLRGRSQSRDANGRHGQICQPHQRHGFPEDH